MCTKVTQVSCRLHGCGCLSGAYSRNNDDDTLMRSAGEFLSLLSKSVQGVEPESTESDMQRI